MNPSDRHITVIGAGIIGVCCAHVLNSRGFRVTLIDRDAGTSRGNAGAIAVAVPVLAGHIAGLQGRRDVVITPSHRDPAHHAII